MSQNELKIPGYCIAQKTDGSGKEQIVKYFQKVYGENNDNLYWGYYGLHGYHEISLPQLKILENLQIEKNNFLKKRNIICFLNNSITHILNFN